MVKLVTREVRDDSSMCIGYEQDCGCDACIERERKVNAELADLATEYDELRRLVILHADLSRRHALLAKLEAAFDRPGFGRE